MGMRAYSEIYLKDAAVTLGDMFDYAICACKEDGDMVFQMLITTGAARHIERGEPAYVSSMGGIEFAINIIRETTGRLDFPMPQFRGWKAPEYWAGWALAHYQWYTARPFAQIKRFLPFSEIVRVYPALHEADITKFYEFANGLAAEVPDTNLKKIRNAAGYSQSGLARASDVGLRSIQLYEQRRKDINKAQVITIIKIARALACDVEDLLEYV